MLATAIDVRASLRTVGVLTRWFSLTLAVPIPVALLEHDSLTPFTASMLIGIGLGLLLERAAHSTAEVGLREGFLIVALVWLVVTGIGCLPYIFEGGDASRPVDAYFETMSGFTTTGSSIIGDLASHSRSILFWRGLTQWLGGIGIVAFALAVLPRIAASRALAEDESPGPEFEKLSPRIRQTAQRVWAVYLLASALEVLLLFGGHLAGIAPRMHLYDALLHTFATVSTGGFSPNPKNLADYGAYSQWVAIVFMVFGGSNLALWYLAARRSARYLLRDTEFRAYLGLLLVGGLAMSAIVAHSGITHGLHSSVRHGLFQTVSIMTTTGFGSTDYTLWPRPALSLIVLLMFVGACSGSTGGAIKVVRVVIVTRALRREVATAVHPEEVLPVRLRGRAIPEPAVRTAMAFTLLYLLLLGIGTVVILTDAYIRNEGISGVEALAAAASTLGNVGGGLTFFGPYGSSARFSDVATVTQTILMWLGRLELIPVVVLTTRRYWLR